MAMGGPHWGPTLATASPSPPAAFRPDASGAGLRGPAPPVSPGLADSGTAVVHEIIADYAQRRAGIF